MSDYHELLFIKLIKKSKHVGHTFISSIRCFLNACLAKSFCLIFVSLWVASFQTTSAHIGHFGSNVICLKKLFFSVKVGLLTGPESSNFTGVVAGSTFVMDTFCFLNFGSIFLMFLNNDIPEFLVGGEVNELSGDMITGKPFDCTEFCTPKTIKNLLLSRMANLPEYNLNFLFYYVFEYYFNWWRSVVKLSKF